MDMPQIYKNPPMDNGEYTSLQWSDLWVCVYVLTLKVAHSMDSRAFCPDLSNLVRQ